jgi:CBS domain-containing protein
MTATSSPQFELSQRTVRDVMRTGIVGCGPETPLEEVARLMSEHGIHCVIVSGLTEGRQGTRLVWGVVSDLDLTRAAATGADVNAGEVAATEPVTATPSDSLEDVAHVMADHDVAHLVVVDEKDAEPIGVISTLDLARAIANAA